MNKPLWMQRIQRLTSGNGLRAQFLRGGLGSLAIKAANAVLVFTLAVVLARTLGPEGYGVYSFALALIMLSAIPAQVGVPQLVVRETAKAQANGSYGLMRGLWRWANLAVLVFSALALTAVGGIVWFTDIGGDGARVTTLAVGIALIPIIALANVRGACLRGLRKVILGQLPESVLQPIFLLILIWVAWLFVTELSPQMVMSIYAISALSSFAIGVWFLRRARPIELKFQLTPAYDSLAWGAAVLPLAMISGVQLINSYADLLILGVFREDEEVGIYRAASQIALLVAFAFHVLGKVIQPHLARHFSLAELSRAQAIVTISANIVSVYGVVIAVAIMFFAADLLRIIFGATFIQGALALTILAFGKIFYSSMGISWHVLIMAGHQNAMMRVTIIATVANIILNFLLVPTFGMEGAAAATSAAFALFFLLASWKSRKLVGIDPWPKWKTISEFGM